MGKVFFSFCLYNIGFPCQLQNGHLTLRLRASKINPHLPSFANAWLPTAEGSEKGCFHGLVLEYQKIQIRIKVPEISQSDSCSEWLFPASSWNLKESVSCELPKPHIFTAVNPDSRRYSLSESNLITSRVTLSVYLIGSSRLHSTVALSLSALLCSA